MRHRLLLVSVTAVVIAALIATVALGASSLTGSYKGKATKGTTTPDGKGTTLAFAVKVVSTCPKGDGTFNKALCLEWTPGISMPVVCEYWNSADPTHRPQNERRSVPSLAAVSRAGHVDLTMKSNGPGYSDATRLVVSINKRGKATGSVTYTATGRSAIANKDCTGRLVFTAKHS